MTNARVFREKCVPLIDDADNVLIKAVLDVRSGRLIGMIEQADYAELADHEWPYR